jgi:hypothetical protein
MNITHDLMHATIDHAALTQINIAAIGYDQAGAPSQCPHDREARKNGRDDENALRFSNLDGGKQESRAAREHKKTPPYKKVRNVGGKAIWADPLSRRNIETLAVRLPAAYILSPACVD